MVRTALNSMQRIRSAWRLQIAAACISLFSLTVYATDVRIAAIGDFGRDGQAEADVAAMVKQWDVSDVLALGDCNYSKYHDLKMAL